MDSLLQRSIINAIDGITANMDQVKDLFNLKLLDSRVCDEFDYSKKMTIKKSIERFIELDVNNESNIKQLGEYICDLTEFTFLNNIDNKEMYLLRAKNAQDELKKAMMSLYMR